MPKPSKQSKPMATGGAVGKIGVTEPQLTEKTRDLFSEESEGDEDDVSNTEKNVNFGGWCAYSS
eukprot:3543559-Prymnesium_polylepis.1